ACENGIIQIPDRSLPTAGISDYPVRVAVTVKVSYSSRSSARCNTWRGSRCRCGRGRSCRRGRCAIRRELHVVHEHVRRIAEVISVRQELDAYCHSRVCPHVHRLVHPVVGRTLMEDAWQNGPRGFCEVRVLPVESDGIYCARPVPETQRTSTSRHGDLLVEGAITWSLATRQATHVTRKVAAMDGIGRGTRHKRSRVGV